jgi:RHH-type transcriptional regulator, proline utilization regulon repressor / proline dehydrogenase / delta 1-pyrroline-5-carboxylate dehydrogenase
MTNHIATFLNTHYRLSEDDAVNALIQGLEITPSQTLQIEEEASALVATIRKAREKTSAIDAFMREYDLSSEEGIALMCTAEAMLRIPDAKTVDELIQDKLGQANWSQHLSGDKSFAVNAATWGLMLTGKILAPKKMDTSFVSNQLQTLIKRTSLPVIRTMVGKAMRILGEQFVMGRTIDAALKRAKAEEAKGYRFSYDMLGEAARTEADAQAYLVSYEQAIIAVGQATTGKTLAQRAEISVKLSALHPRYEYTQRERVLRELTPRLKHLALTAKAHNIGLTVDAEETDRLVLSLEVFSLVYGDPDLSGWCGLGLAVQAYQKRAPRVIDFLVELYQQHKRKIQIRLVKGAYWDSEIKLAQELGLENYPVYTRKVNTDISYTYCAQKILSHRDALTPRFATHNARTIAEIISFTKGNYSEDFEFQCLHGMGHGVYGEIVGSSKRDIPCRVYAPVGGHESLLPYLVRRLLENGANTSFVNRIADDNLPIEKLIQSPLALVATYATKQNPYIPLPQNLYGETRINSKGLDLSDSAKWDALEEAIRSAMKTKFWQKSLTQSGEKAISIYAPADPTYLLGDIPRMSQESVAQALDLAAKDLTWSNTPVDARAQCLLRMADLLEEKTADLIALISLEGGRTIKDALSEIREAIDFCRYYAEQAKIHLTHPIRLPGPTGETNDFSLHPRGPIVCISPWNFPLAIFLGQVVAALVAGNPVLAKPAEQTPFIACVAVDLLHQAGVPKSALQLILGEGRTVGTQLVNDIRTKGVIFTGSTYTAWLINQSLASRKTDIVPLIAETGGLNVMIADSSALLEQLVMDVIQSAFGSVGQRCSALRVLFIPEAIADKFNAMLAGAMKELVVGEPSALSTDIGPMIEASATDAMNAHLAKMQEAGARFIASVPCAQKSGHFFAPTAIELDDIHVLTEEVFGPILHIKRYKSGELQSVIDTVNGLGYGLTLGIQSRINETIYQIVSQAKVGNIYVNRTMIGAVVGVQPFGGQGLSGTGPKAGGPHYLLRLCTEQVLTVNTAAAGGNASLMSLPSE